MPIKIVKEDITKSACDAIVNPTDKYYSHADGADKAIHDAAGKQLYEECVKNGPLLTGKVVVTRGYALPCSFVIHIASPQWHGGYLGEESLLRLCYSDSLKAARNRGCKSIAFPLISSGTHGFPKDKVMKIALSEISKFIRKNEMLVYIVVHDEDDYLPDERLIKDIENAIIEADYREPPFPMFCYCKPTFPMSCYSKAYDFGLSDEERASKEIESSFENMEKSFSELLIELIEKHGLSAPESYKRSNISRKTFSKIKNNRNYQPERETVFSFAIGLRLSLDETNELLNAAGYALSQSSKLDKVVEYYITTGNYEDIHDVNAMLCYHGLPTLCD